MQEERVVQIWGSRDSEGLCVMLRRLVWYSGTYVTSQ
jgi:hypothetical protein